MPFIPVDQENDDEISIHFEDHGSGQPIVLIHGYPFSGAAWEKQEARLLAAGYRVITYDRRGFGFSSHPSIGYDYDTFADDLHSVLTELNLHNVTLIGHSMGTGEITRYLSRHGNDRVARAVFISPIPPFLLKTADNPTGLDQSIFEDFKDQIRRDRYAFITTFLKNFYNLGLLHHGVSEEKLQVDFAIAASSSPIAFLECVDTWLTDFRADLAKVKVPSLILHGDADQILPLANTAQLMAPEIGAELKVIEGGSHGIPWTHAEEINEEILRFLASHRRPHLQEVS